jgi:hypothetical protein
LDGPTQHSMIKSRVSLAQVTSLGSSSVYVLCVRVHVYVAWSAYVAWDSGGCDHFCDGGLGEREIVVGGWEARVAFAV